MKSITLIIPGCVILLIIIYPLTLTNSNELYISIKIVSNLYHPSINIISYIFSSAFKFGNIIVVSPLINL